MTTPLAARNVGNKSGYWLSAWLFFDPIAAFTRNTRLVRMNILSAAFVCPPQPNLVLQARVLPDKFSS